MKPKYIITENDDLDVVSYANTLEEVKEELTDRVKRYGSDDRYQVWQHMSEYCASINEIEIIVKPSER